MDPIYLHMSRYLRCEKDFKHSRLVALMLTLQDDIVKKYNVYLL